MDRYQEEKAIGRGIFGEVHCVIHRETKEKRAIKKVILIRGHVDCQEAQTGVEKLVKLNHCNVVRYVESFEVRGCLHIVMAFCAGGDLEKKIDQKQSSGTSFTHDEIFNMLRQLCQALKYVHEQKMVHRNIKPRNILFTDESTLMLGDFGLAKILDSLLDLVNSHNIGAFQYTAPEIFAGQPYTNECDMWSLGCVLYELVTLKKPFGENDLLDVISRISTANYYPLPPNVKSDLRNMIIELIQKEESKRPTASELLKRLIYEGQMKGSSDGPIVQEFHGQTEEKTEGKSSKSETNTDVLGKAENTIKMDDMLNFVLLGKTGEGKSATGNSLLNRQHFKTSNSASHETKELSSTFRIFGNYSFVVVDGPDLISGVEDQIETAKNTIIQAITMCYGGVDAFLFVMKFGNKFTAKDKSALEALKQVLGDRYLDHVIVVVTYGDVYQSQLEEEECELSFDDWCSKQTGEFCQLYVSCKKRFVLFNNKEKDEKKRQEQVAGLVQLVLDVRDNYGRYTSQYLKHTEGKVERLMPELTKRQEQATAKMVDTKQIKEEVKLNFLLMGKTGQGKSATGNSILQRQAFIASASTSSVTKKVDFSFARFKHYTLLVVDGPGLADTELHYKKNTTLNLEEEKMNMAKEIANAAKHMDEALAMCYGGVDAFLFVMKFHIRFTREDQSALEALKHIFGDRYLDHVIVVVTCGDLFPGEHEDPNISFDEWCRQQEGAFRQLYDDCKGRFVLFNNREKDEEEKRAQIKKIVKQAEFLKISSGRYTSECFQEAESGRQKLIVELKAPLLTREIQEKISLLAADIEHLGALFSYSEKEKIRARIQDLKREIELQDQGYNVLGGLWKKVKDMEGNLDNVGKLHIMAHELENMRKDPTFWSKIKDLCNNILNCVRKWYNSLTGIS